MKLNRKCQAKLEVITSTPTVKVTMSKRRFGLLLGLGIFSLATAPLQAADQPSLESSPVPPQGFDKAREGIEKG